MKTQVPTPTIFEFVVMLSSPLGVHSIPGILRTLGSSKELGRSLESLRIVRDSYAVPIAVEVLRTMEDNPACAQASLWPPYDAEIVLLLR